MSDKLIKASDAVDIVARHSALYGDGEVSTDDGEALLYDIMSEIMNLSSAEPERKTGKWIPCSERLPEKPNTYTVTDSKGDVVRFVFNDTESSREYWLRCAKAWMPLPEPYREEE